SIYLSGILLKPAPAHIFSCSTKNNGAAKRAPWSGKCANYSSGNICIYNVTICAGSNCFSIIFVKPVAAFLRNILYVVPVSGRISCYRIEGKNSFHVFFVEFFGSKNFIFYVFDAFDIF